ncbi:hypothetical protein [Arthrobacter globiformis]|uniref:hypothetical protein n=1 Tax=Arthrobacter globiformis TaxID=1665 RepID=UPI002782F2B3|nr:hypothetical protein [Arthrobacter globiformis]MDQ0864936.1 membrane protein DedA with SNARE-associated domain [Arthrobacter globiformis]
MHCPRFLAINAVGGLTWGTGLVLLGYLAGNSYEAVAKTAGRDVTAVAVIIAIVAVAVWRVRSEPRKRQPTLNPPEHS